MTMGFTLASEDDEIELARSESTGDSPEHDVVASIVAVQPASFDAWYEANFGSLVRLAYLLVGSRDLATDLTQDAMVNVLRRWDRISDPDSYARRAVANACHSHHRRLRVVRRQPPPTYDVAELGARELTDALARLSERQRAVVVMRYWADLPEKEIAEVLGIRRGSVASLLHRAHTELRKVIEP